MSFLSRLFNLDKNIEVRSEGKDGWGDTNTNFSGLKVGNFSVKNIEGINTVFVCCRILSDTVSKMPVHLIQETEQGQIKQLSNPLYRLLHTRPNGYQNIQTFFSTLELHRSIKGNAYAYINRVDGFPVSFTIIHPDEILGGDVEEEQVFYVLKRGGVIPSRDILHFKNISVDGINGLNPLEAARLSISIDQSAQNIVNNFYKNGAHGVLQGTTSVDIPTNSQKDFYEAIKKYKKEWKGVNAAGGLILPPPFSKLEALSLNFDDIKYIEIAKLSQKSIASIYGVPSVLLEHNDSNYSTVEQMLLFYKSNTISSIVNIYQAELENKLLNDEMIDKGFKIQMNTNALLATDTTSRINYLSQLSRLGGLSINELRKIEGFEKIDNEMADYHFIQSQNVPIERYEEMKKDAPQAVNLISN
ncbi:phage portal protein [uncultured Imperialibacter sp.]|uniref:phage portal protein n=1 Tax=uncultured Imperialibacter sp. TaxID=1672639 RepID=UPI0030D73A6F|tara:strand:- start:11312 stop:12556 length:1245 start_codon:yes stop_codon:yes gene_type:complete